MFNLFLKDFYLIRKHLWVAMFYSFMMFFLFSSHESELYGMIYSIGTTMIGYTMIMYTTAYDDKNNSEVFLNSLPISRSKIVLSRYISIFMFIIIGVISMMIASFVLKSFNILNISRMFKFHDFVNALIGLCCISFLYLPVYFKYGYVKAKMFNLILFAIGFGGPMLIKNILRFTKKPLWLDKFIMYLHLAPKSVINLLFIIAVVILGLISFSISSIIYRKREF
ncbi:ABC-2 family transporter protein [Caminicella sporogenes DSM 14501]|uniref:ABC-2 family transporter protein n=1 Tax=Caminicella sporogenes DSM 14501 TaxID=1121266 RepID=A0A1M6Q8X4_9FIRM|nr:ABC-2 transporter permease [Caminicella sporogenes]SHK16547.1 ABC-2 family transporter protein [Caminicella sporogenes DSM 14501]